MQNYIVAHYGTPQPSFTYAETIDAARLLALTILMGQQYTATDIVSIVDATTDEVLYYGKGKKLVAQLQAASPRKTRAISGFLPIRLLLNWVSPKLAGTATR